MSPLWLTRLSAFFARYKGLPILTGIGLIVVGLLAQFVPLGPFTWIADTHALLYLGAAVGLLGVLLADALG